MSALVLITFDREDDADAALTDVRRRAAAGPLHLTDIAVIATDPDRTVHVKNEESSAAEAETAIGDSLGLLTSVIVPRCGRRGRRRGGRPDRQHIGPRGRQRLRQ